MSDVLNSWGGTHHYEQAVHRLQWRDQNLPETNGKTLLPFGNGRSYGDSCLNQNGSLIHTRGLDRFIEFDPKKGVLKCEAGILLGEIIDLVLPFGWFLPVSPGTKFVTLGGAIANDIHGKNHHSAGTFGCFVRSLELWTSDGLRRVCSETSNPELFRATIGGLGLTGLIAWAEFTLIPIEGPFIETQTSRFHSLNEFFEITRASTQDRYTVAWVDCFAGGERGVFIKGDHASQNEPRAREKKPRSVPFHFPKWALTSFSMRCFNHVYFRSHPKGWTRSLSHYDPFFYPLDRILHWNRIYGKRGFFQFQCVVPEESISEIFKWIQKSGKGSFLAVLKVFGDKKSPGLLSFPQPGVTLALDFANEGAPTLKLLAELEALVLGSGGRLYPAKDASMSAAGFKKSYSQWSEFARHCDPKFSSSFWRRVTA